MPVPKIFMIAGEASGDALGGPLMAAFKARDPMCVIKGVGGAQMQAQGLESMLPMEDLCVMGLWEVLWHLPRLLKLIQGLAEEIEKEQPDILVTIDLPDFNFRLAEKLKKRGKFKGKIIHYVAPSVWAWRPGRAKKVAGYLDGMMCLFPFEPEYFEKEGLRAAYVGHPLIENDLSSCDVERFNQAHEIDEEAVKIGLLFGSREQEIKSLSPIILEATDLIREQIPDVHFIAPTLPHMDLDIVDILQPTGAPFSVVAKPEKKWDALMACDVAIAVSGTVGLELAYAGIPHVIGYKMHPLSWLLAKILVKTPYAHLTNILLDAPVVPELLQGDCKAEKIAKGVLELLLYDEKADAQKTAFKQLDEKLKPEGLESPSERAVQFILQR